MVKCLICDTQYTAIQTIRDFYAHEGNFIGRNEEPPNGLCPECGRYEKEKI